MWCKFNIPDGNFPLITNKDLRTGIDVRQEEGKDDVGGEEGIDDAVGDEEAALRCGIHEGDLEWVHPRRVGHHHDHERLPAPITQTSIQTPHMYVTFVSLRRMFRRSNELEAQELACIWYPSAK